MTDWNSIVENGGSAPISSIEELEAYQRWSKALPCKHCGKLKGDITAGQLWNVNGEEKRMWMTENDCGCAYGK